MLALIRVLTRFSKSLGLGAVKKRTLPFFG
jgi:hypothetical protein